MPSFRYPPIVTPLSLGTAAAYTLNFAQHAEWLADNAIAYTLEAYHWPDWVWAAMGVDGYDKLVRDFTVIIDDDNDAVTFCLFSGIAAL